VLEISNSYKSMVQKFENTVTQFAEDPKEKKSPDQFLTPIAQFMDSFQKAFVLTKQNLLVTSECMMLNLKEFL